MVSVPTTIPEQGQLVTVRRRQYVVTDVAVRARLKGIPENIDRETLPLGAKIAHPPLRISGCFRWL